MNLTLIQPTWSAYPYALGFPYMVSICPYFLIWYPYAPTSLYGNAAHCSGNGVAMGCYGRCIVPRTSIVTSQWYCRCCSTGIRADVSGTPNNALATRMHGDHGPSIDELFVGFPWDLLHISITIVSYIRLKANIWWVSSCSGLRPWHLIELMARLATSCAHE